MDYGKLSREFPGKGRKTFGLDHVITKLLKRGTSLQAQAYRRLRVPNERRMTITATRLQACVLANGRYFEHRMSRKLWQQQQ